MDISVSGEYSCLKVELIFKREFSYYLITIYVPCCMLVIVSWVSFWLDQNAIPARVSLGVTTLLTMSTQTSGINAQLPPVSYTKAIDVWTGVSQECSGIYYIIQCYPLNRHLLQSTPGRNKQKHLSLSCSARLSCKYFSLLFSSLARNNVKVERWNISTYCLG